MAAIQNQRMEAYQCNAIGVVEMQSIVAEVSKDTEKVESQRQSVVTQVHRRRVYLRNEINQSRFVFAGLFSRARIDSIRAIVRSSVVNVFVDLLGIVALLLVLCTVYRVPTLVKDLRRATVLP